MKIFIFVFLTLLNINLKAQTPGKFIDERDSQEYRTVTYKVKLDDSITISMTWMAENLNFDTEASYCYDDINLTVK